MLQDCRLFIEVGDKEPVSGVHRLDCSFQGMKRERSRKELS